MEKYKDLGRDSGILEYEYDDDWIRIRFKHGKPYLYEASVIGSVHLAEMKKLADAGDGLNAYINTHPDVKKGYSKEA